MSLIVVHFEHVVQAAGLAWHESKTSVDGLRYIRLDLLSNTFLLVSDAAVPYIARLLCIFEIFPILFRLDRLVLVVDVLGRLCEYGTLYIVAL